MIPNWLKRLRIPAIPAAALAATLACVVPHAEEGKAEFHAAGWSQYGQIAKSMDTVENKELDGKGMLGYGAQFALSYQAKEWLTVNAGMGVAASNFIAARPINGFYAPVNIGPYVASANAEIRAWDSDNQDLSLRVGLFPYDYAPDAQNLGLYLFRGPVYPGFLTSGFETKYVMPVANTLGLQMHHRVGPFEHDLLLTFETDWHPYWDLTPTWIGTLHAGKAFRVGVGAQFYHYIPIDSKLTSPHTDANRYVDTAARPLPDTSYISFKGIKLMGNASFDPKPLFGWDEDGPMGPEDLKLYGEVAVLGLDGDKAHNDLYGPVSKRMPMMVGFNLPAFKYLDRLNIEVEYYAAPWVDDPSIYNHTSGTVVTPIPKISALDTNTTKDNLKWSIYASKVVANHVKISAQAASDHFRPGIFQGYGDNNPPLNNVPFFSPKEWYWTAKIAYFF